MRTVLGLGFALVFFVGCNGGGLPITGNGVQGGKDGGTIGGNNDLSGGGGGAVDMAQGMPPGGKCATACDCEAGLACVNGQCQASMLGKLFCCDSTNCPQGSFCQSSSGNFGQCGGGGGGGGSCTTACDCMPGLACQQGNCTMSMFGAVYCCDNGMCPPGSFCQSSMGGFMQCGGGGGGGGQCTTIRCRTNNDQCPNLGCGTCDPMTRRCSG